MLRSSLSSQLRRWGWAIALFTLTFMLATPTAWASLQDDRFDGNIFALYAGNGSLVPPRVDLKTSLKQEKPALLLFYLDDSRDCKQFATTYSQLQAGYGRAADFIPINADTVRPQSGTPSDESYYYSGQVPQLVLIDQQGKVVLDEVGQVPYEAADDRLREVFELVPRKESETLRRRYLNEVNSEIVPDN